MAVDAVTVMLSTFVRVAAETDDPALTTSMATFVPLAMPATFDSHDAAVPAVVNASILTTTFSMFTMEPSRSSSAVAVNVNVSLSVVEASEITSVFAYVAVEPVNVSSEVVPSRISVEDVIDRDTGDGFNAASNEASAAA